MRPCAIFDLDGTLVDSLPAIRAVIDDMLAARGASRRTQTAEARAHASLGGRAMVAALLAGEARDADLDVADFRRRYADRPTPRDSVFPGVVEGLERLLAADITLGLCSNKPQHLCDKVLGEIGLRPLFASVVGARDGVPLKPNPALLRLVTRELGVAAPDCVFVGDSELDHAIASATEMRCILVTYGYGDLDGVDPLVPRADTFDDVAGQVAAMLSRGASPWLSTVGTRA